MTGYKNHNISETIIEIYKDEDLVRSFEFDLEKIGKHVINHLPISNIDKLSRVNYFEGLIDRMKKEGLEESGHLKESEQLVGTLENLSTELLKNDLSYQEIYAQAKVAIDDNKKLSKGLITSDIQICLNGIYGFLILKLNGKKLSEIDKGKVDKFGDVLSYLSFKHQERSENN